MNCERILCALAGASLLAGCAQTYSPSMGTIDPADFGEANRQTYAAMVIDPDPIYDGALTTSGEHAAQALERYRTDRVKQPERISTSELGAGASAGGTPSPGN